MGTERRQPQLPRRPRLRLPAWLVAGILVIGGSAWLWSWRESPSRNGPKSGSVQRPPATPEEIARWSELAHRYERENDLVKAAAVLQEALQSRLPERAAMAFRHRRIEVLILLGDASAARQELRRLNGLPLSQSDQVRVLVHEARLSRLEGHPERALACLDKALPLLDYAPPAVCERGIVNLDLGHLQAAVRDLSQVVKAVPNHEIAHFKLAEAYRRLKRPRDAERHHREYLRLHRAALKRSLPDEQGNSP